MSPKPSSRLLLFTLILIGALTATAATAPQIGTLGLDLSAGDPTVKPGDDFFRYANGRWFDSFAIPADRSSYGAFTGLDVLSEQRVRELIEQAAAQQSAPGTPAQRIGDYYAAFTDIAGIESRGLAPVQPDLDRIAAAMTPADFARLFAQPGIISPINVGVTPDLKDPTCYAVAIVQGGLGLPDRDYYLKDDPKMQEIRTQYLACIRQFLDLAGIPDGPAKADAIFAFEKSLAEASWSRERRRQVETRYNPRTRAETIAFAPGLDWPVFLEAYGVGTRDRFILSELSAIQDLAAVIGRTDPATIRAYLAFHVLQSAAAALPKRFDDAAFVFAQALSGQPQQRERWKRGVSAVNVALGEQVGELYAAKYFPPESKAQMEALVANLRRALAHRLDRLDWMTPATKAKAHAKLATFTPKIGYPDKWKDYSTLVIRSDDPFGNARRTAEWNWQRDLARLDQPIDRAEWRATPQTINAYYYAPNNEIVFPAGILQPPFFDPHADLAVNYGAIGAVIGHEISHGFDDQGRKFGPDGRLEDWWTKEDAEAFSTRAARLTAQFDAFEALPGLQVKGALTLGENIGDLGGLAMAYDAYHLASDGKEPPVINGLTGDQRFFLAWAQVWRAKYREPALRRLVQTDPHSPPNFRVNGPLQNMDAWYQAFNVQPGDKLYLPPESRIRIW